MKKLLILALGIMAFTACKKDETAPPAQTWPDYLIGTWNLDDVDMEISTTIMGFPVTFDAESLTSTGGYTFNSDNTFTFDWSADMVFELPIIGADTIPVDQTGGGTYTVLGEDQIELDQNGQKTILDLISKSPTTVVTEFEDMYDLDSVSADVEVRAVLSK